MRKAALVFVLLLGCAPDPPGEPRARRAAIIGAPAVPELGAVVMVTHRDQDDVCSGAAIAPSLVVTAKHCVFRRADSGDEPLPADGLRVAFGPDEERFEYRYATALSWIGMPDERDVETAVDAGEDVALIHLDEPAPDSIAPLPVRRGYQPGDRDELALVGFGLSELGSGVAGVRRAGTAEVTGFDPETGLLQLSGAAACFGDSGGPVLFGGEGSLVGVIGQVAGVGDGGYCEAGISLASSIANPRVRALLLGACREAGGCGPRAVDADAGAQAPAAPTVADDAGRDASGPSAASDAAMSDATTTATPRDAERAGCGCSAAGAAVKSTPVGLWAFALCMLWLARPASYRVYWWTRWATTPPPSRRCASAPSTGAASRARLATRSPSSKSAGGRT